MKNLKLLLLLVLTISFVNNSEAQLLKKLKKKAEDKIVREADKTINGNGSEKEKEKEKRKRNKRTTNGNSRDYDEDNLNVANSPNLWRNFKFIPGEKVIFYDDLRTEEVGEFPSRWDLVNGNVEVARLNGEKVIIFNAEHRNTITPLFNKTGYLGDEFTIEYDVFVPNFRDGKIWHMENKLFFNAKFSKVRTELELKPNQDKINGWASNSKFKIEEVNIGNQNEWHHVSISYYKGKYKLYYDEKRVANIPKFDMIPDVFGLDLFCYANNDIKHPSLAIKNIRIAHGGGEMYKRIIADGKYETNGILFDSGKTKIKPQSMGIINKMVTVLKENNDWSIEIIGHTDSDGDDATNIKLSTSRAEAVKQAIVDQGIKANKITVVGKGENEPINNNKTPEEKANNRRVVFVKK